MFNTSTINTSVFNTSTFNTSMFHTSTISNVQERQILVRDITFDMDTHSISFVIVSVSCIRCSSMTYFMNALLQYSMLMVTDTYVINVIIVFSFVFPCLHGLDGFYTVKSVCW